MNGRITDRLLIKQIRTECKTDTYQLKNFSSEKSIIGLLDFFSNLNIFGSNSESWSGRVISFFLTFVFSYSFSNSTIWLILKNKLKQSNENFFINVRLRIFYLHILLLPPLMICLFCSSVSSGTFPLCVVSGTLLLCYRFIRYSSVGCMLDIGSVRYVSISRTLHVLYVFVWHSLHVRFI